MATLRAALHVILCSASLRRVEGRRYADNIAETSFIQAKTVVREASALTIARLANDSAHNERSLANSSQQQQQRKDSHLEALESTVRITNGVRPTLAQQRSRTGAPRALSHMASSRRDDPLTGVPLELRSPQDLPILEIPRDIFPDHRDIPISGNAGLNFFASRPLADWLILGFVATFLFVFDLCVVQRFSSTFVHHILTIVFNITVAMIFNAFILYREGTDSGTLWFTGYILEWMLSLDNLMIFHFVFSTFQTPSKQIHKALSAGILGAIVLRMTFFMVLSFLMHIVIWVRIPFGLMLIWSGVQSVRGGDDDAEVEDTYVVRAVRCCLGSRLHEGYDTSAEGRFFVEDSSGRIQATLLVVVVVCLEGVDLVFAFDSVTAKIAQIPDLHTAFSSSVLAMFGLRATFFVLQDLMENLELVQYGVGIILIFIGIELCLSMYLSLSASTVCVIILSVFGASILGSIAKQKLNYETCEEAS